VPPEATRKGEDQEEAREAGKVPDASRRDFEGNISESSYSIPPQVRGVCWTFRK
jgi:hypothetical protein